MKEENILSEDDKDDLRKMAGKKSLQAMSEWIGCDISAVLRFLKSENLPTSCRRKWSQEEKEFIIKNLLTIGNTKLAWMLGTTPENIASIVENIVKSGVNVKRRRHGGNRTVTVELKNMTTPRYEVLLKTFSSDYGKYLIVEYQCFDSFREAILFAKEKSMLVGKKTVCHNTEVLSLVTVVCYYYDKKNTYNSVWTEDYVNGKELPRKAS